MHKYKTYISLLLVFLLASCESNSFDVKPDNKINRINDNYIVEEIDLPKELESMNQPVKTITIFQNQGYQLTLHCLDHLKSHLYPIESSYQYNLLTGELKLKDRLMDEDYRVYYQINDEFGGLYELIGYYKEGMQYLVVYYNGKPIENTETLSINTFNLRDFQLLNGCIYIFIEEILDIDDLTRWTMYELNQGTANVHFALDTVRAWGFNSLEKDELSVVLPNIQNYNKNEMSYVIHKNGEYYIELFDGINIVEIKIPEIPSTVIPLENYVLYYFTEWLDENGDEVEYPLYQYDINTKKTKRIDTLDHSIGMTYHMQGNEFYKDGRTGKVTICSVENDQLIYRDIEGIHDVAMINAIYQLDNKTDFIHITDYNSNNHWYLIHWD